MEVRMRLWEVIPFSVMVLMEGCTVGLTIMTKTVMAKGMSQFVFVVYSNALSSIILLPYSLMFRRTQQSFFTFPLLTRFFFLGLTGITIAQIFAFTGLSYSSPILACGMGNLIPAFSFVLAIILRTTKLDWRVTSGQAKIIGTFISISGGTLMILYKGPLVRKTAFSAPFHHLELIPRHFIFSSTPEYWALGGIVLAVASLSASVWGIIQVGTVKQYPEPITIAALYTSMGTIQSAIVAFVAERNLSAWKLELNMELLLIFLSAIFGSAIRCSVHIWCMHNKGPFYVPMFKPFGIIIASIASVIFFGDSLHYGSVIGAYIIGIGYYTLMWGQIREDDMKAGCEGIDSSEQKVPLLQEEEQV
ncbi:WAT1-related protein At1g70260-like [Vitis riparia]|uniref:WAT1-related protein At1g70260-like n=1 Tax=Vitis riparia TaxID=96939 RepID=UPI00155A1458|nr:WAT1-related protein At1g70260-like [Vitis riparia]XP_034682315.1 WAT1-related protein At1g70260-like [Vitis riparia]